MNFDTLIQELKALNLPANEFAITSSGPLGVRNLREINDLDIIVYPQLWQKLSQTYPVVLDGDFESIYLGNIQILGPGSWFTDPAFGSVEHQIDTADNIDGLRYVQLPIILEIKKLKTRTKDKKDVILIQDYLARS